MNSAVIFHGVNALDFEELRLNALRIPEVISRVKKAQKIWSDAGLPSFDFMNFIGSENKVFYSNIKLKSLCSAIVQIGLYERYVIKNSEPQFLLGEKSGDSAMMYISGFVTYPELILSSQAARSQGQGFTMTPDRSKLLSGINISQLAAIDLRDDKAVELQVDDSKHSAVSLQHLMRYLIDETSVKNFVNVGPGSSIERLRSEFNKEDLTFVESVDCDPMLNWFWSSLNPLEFQTESLN